MSERVELEFDADEGDALAGIERLIRQYQRLEEQMEDTARAAAALAAAEAAASAPRPGGAVPSQARVWRPGGAGGGGRWITSDTRIFEMGPASRTVGFSPGGYAVGASALVSDTYGLQRQREHLVRAERDLARTALLGLSSGGPGSSVLGAQMLRDRMIAANGYGGISGSQALASRIGGAGTAPTPVSAPGPSGPSMMRRALGSIFGVDIDDNGNFIGGGGSSGGGGGFSRGGGGDGGGRRRGSPWWGYGDSDLTPQLGDLVRGILPGGKRQSVGAVGTLGAITAGAGASVLPGVAGLGLAGGAFIGSAVAGIATLVTAFSGLGDAIGGDKEAYDALSESQKRYVDSIRTQLPVLSELKKVVQAGVLPGATQGLRAALSPEGRGALRSGLDSLGQQMGSSLYQIGSFLGSEETSGKIESFLKDSAGYTQQFTTGMIALTDTILSMLQAGQPFIAWVGEGITRGAEWANAWIDAKIAGGDFAEFLERSKESIRVWGDALGSAISFLYELGETVRGPLEYALGKLSDGLGVLGDDISANRERIQEFINEGIDAFAGAVEAAYPFVKALADIIGDLVHAIGEVADAVGGWELAFKIILAGVLAKKIGEIIGAVRLLGAELLITGGKAATASTAAAGAATAAGVAGSRAAGLKNLGRNIGTGLAVGGGFVLGQDLLGDITGGPRDNQAQRDIYDAASVDPKRAVEMAAKYGYTITEQQAREIAKQPFSYGLVPSKSSTPGTQPGATGKAGADLAGRIEKWKQLGAHFGLTEQGVEVFSADYKTRYARFTRDTGIPLEAYQAAAGSSASPYDLPQFGGGTAPKMDPKTPSGARQFPEVIRDAEAMRIDRADGSGNDQARIAARERVIARLEKTKKSYMNRPDYLRQIEAALAQLRGEVRSIKEAMQSAREAAQAEKDAALRAYQSSAGDLKPIEITEIARADRSAGYKDDIRERNQAIGRLTGLSAKTTDPIAKAAIESRITELAGQVESIIEQNQGSFTAKTTLLDMLLGIDSDVKDIKADVDESDPRVKKLLGQLRAIRKRVFEAYKGEKPLTAEAKIRLEHKKEDIEKELRDLGKDTGEAYRKMVEEITRVVGAYDLNEAIQKAQGRVLGVKPESVYADGSFSDLIRGIVGGQKPQIKVGATLGRVGSSPGDPHLDESRRAQLAAGDVFVNVNVANGMEFLRDFINVEVEKQTPKISKALGKRATDRLRGGRM